LGIERFSDLLQPRPLKFRQPAKESLLLTSGGKFRFLAPEAMAQGNPELPIPISSLSPPMNYPFRFIVVHSIERHNSQLSQLTWLENTDKEAQALINPAAAKQRKIINGDVVVIYNQYGEIKLRAKTTATVPEDVIIYNSWRDLYGVPVNCLAGVQETDLGRITFGYPGVAYHDTFVNIMRN
jgi:anaerobic selenocysteine-containing dehydrogenase